MDFMSGAINDLISNFVSTVPNVVMAILIYFIGRLIARMVSKFIKKILEKIGIDKLGEKLGSIEMIEKSNFNISLSNIFSKAIYYILMLFIVIISTDILGLEVVSKLVNDIFNFIPNLLVALIILIFGTLAADLLKKLVETTLSSLNVPSYKMIANFIFYFLFVNIFVSALTQSGIETEFLAQNITMIIGGLVLAFAISYGLASKDTVSNYLASFYIKDKFELGDIITIDGTNGEIIDISKSSFTLKTKEGKVVIPLFELTRRFVEVQS